jgi:hypothetical protein
MGPGLASAGTPALADDGNHVLVPGLDHFLRPLLEFVVRLRPLGDELVESLRPEVLRGVGPVSRVLMSQTKSAAARSVARKVA